MTINLSKQIHFLVDDYIHYQFNSYLLTVVFLKQARWTKGRGPQKILVNHETNFQKAMK